ncbi:hypothetical protein [Methylobacterium sp. 22177]|uniref:hypothetical protein n=1 Tax=Methylobacterium sp. 22177 TaxID=3453885 RepID=UPI000426DA89
MSPMDQIRTTGRTDLGEMDAASRSANVAWLVNSPARSFSKMCEQHPEHLGL